MTHFPLPWRVQPHDNYMPEGYDVPVEIIAADGQTVACNTAFYPTEITAGNAALIVAAVNATAPTVAAQQCGQLGGLDAVDMDMIRRGDMLGPELGERAASLIQSQAARIAELGAAIRGLLDCPDIADNDFKDEETHAAERAEAQLAEARKALDGLLKPFEGDDCRYDHHGYCQAHFLQEGDECCVKIARRVREQGGE